MSRVADRHTGRLGNRLADFGSHQPVSVTVAVADHVANRREAQHTTWMLLNPLARAEGVIARITLDCPESVLLRAQVVPHLTNSGQPQAGEPLRDAIIRGANAIGASPSPPPPEPSPCRPTTPRAAADTSPSPTHRPTLAISPYTVVVGAPRSTTLNLRSRMPLATPGTCAVTAPATSCLAAGDVYLAVRVPAGHYEPARTYGWDCWTAGPLASGNASTGSKSSQMGEPGPEVPSVDLSGFALAGSGAVGAAWMHALWAGPGVHGDVQVVDADRDGVTVDNLKRGVLFTRADVGQPKAAAPRCRRTRRSELESVPGPVREQRARSGCTGVGR
jgi:hypothetical protein